MGKRRVKVRERGRVKGGKGVGLEVRKKGKG